MKIGHFLVALVLMLLSTARNHTTCAKGQNDDARLLEAGQPVTSALKGGEAASYRVELLDKEYMHVAVEQRGINVVVVLQSPSGTFIARMDGQDGSCGVEEVSCEASQSGIYLIQVLPKERGANPGAFQIRVEKARKATAKERARISAERFYTEGKVLYEQSGTSEALTLVRRNYEAALSKWREAGDRKWEGITLESLGAALIALNESQAALTCFDQALVIAHETNDKVLEAAALVSAGNAYNNLSQYEKAQQAFEQALAIMHELKERGGEALVLNSLGNLYSSLGQYQKAEESFVQSLAIMREVHKEYGQVAALIDLGFLYQKLKRFNEAKQAFEQALTIARPNDDKEAEAAANSGLGAVSSHLGDFKQAEFYHNQALTLWQSRGNRSGVAGALNNLGQVFMGLKLPQKAVEAFQKALVITREIKDRYGEGTTLGNLMRLWKQQGRAPLAIMYGKQAVNLYQNIRSEIRTLRKELQQSFLHSKEDTYRYLADILISHGRLSEAEEVLALLKDEEYSSLRSRSDPKLEVGYTAAESEAVKALDEVGELGREDNELRARKEKKTLDEKGQQRLEQIDRELLPQANARFRVALATIEKEAPGTAIKTAEVREGQSLMRYLRELGPGTVALYTVVSTEAGKSSKGWVILVTPSFQKAYEMDVADLDQTVASFRQTLRSDRFDPQPVAEKLYRMIFLKPQQQGKTLAEDLEAYLKDQRQKTLMWSLDGVLRYVPMAALHDRKQYLVERYRNEVFTSASLPGLTHATSKEWNALGLGVSKKYEGFSALAGVPQELSAIVKDGSKHTKGVLPGTIKWDDEFKEKSMLDSLSDGYNVVHIASHFSYQAANPERSFLLLGDGGHLEMSKIQDMSALFEKTDLVTLSACDTAVGAMKDANGKDVEGFAYVTQKLGAMSVIASLWPVDDVGTQVLMPKFYALHQQGLSKAEALRQAQLALLNGNSKASQVKAQRSEPLDNQTDSSLPRYPKDSAKPYAHPYYWAPFILIGNWK